MLMNLLKNENPEINQIPTEDKEMKKKNLLMILMMMTIY